MIEVTHLCRHFAVPGGEVRAVEDVSFAVAAGEVYGLLGPNGAGKTTTLRIILGLLPPTSGQATVAGCTPTEHPDEVKRRVGLVSAGTGLYQHLSVRELLLFFADLYGLGPEQARAELERLTGLLGLGEVLDRRCAGLSTGQRQRVNLARALIHQPPVLLLDEPTLGLDVLGSQVVAEFVGHLREQGKAVLLTTHRLDEAERLCDRFGLLHRGRLVVSGTLSELQAATGCRTLVDMFLQLAQAPPALRNDQIPRTNDQAPDPEAASPPVPPPPRVGPWQKLAAPAWRLGRLARKELSESLRDRRTLLTLVLMPLLLYPLLGLAVGQFPLGDVGVAAAPAYRVGFQDDGEGKDVRHYLKKGEEELLRQGAFVTRYPLDAAPAQAASAALPLPELEYVVGPDIEEEVLRGTVDVGLRARPPGRFAEHVGHPLVVDWELLYREDSSAGREAVRHLQRLCEATNARTLGETLRLWKVPQRTPLVRAAAKAVRPPGPRKTSPILTLVPLVLILMTITGAVYPAIDLTAGERERGTLEVLMAAPLPRLSLLLAKYAAVMFVAMLTALVNLAAMAATLWYVEKKAAGSVAAGSLLEDGSLSPLLFLEVFGLLLLFAAFFSAVLLALTSFARSFKEAQAYLIPLMLLSLVPGMLSLMPGLHLSGPLLLVPLLNVVLLAHDLLTGRAEPAAAAIVVAATLTYALAAIAVAARLFGADGVRGGQRSRFAGLRRRPQ
jgi:ABC-type Na+ transport system ATPase subunit NatA/ABC-type Na+ efflux pump permease subunit